MSPLSLQFLLALAVKGTILLSATTLAAALSPRARASVRHALWAGADRGFGAPGLPPGCGPSVVGLRAEAGAHRHWGAVRR